jgi:proline dehydrogenase
LALMLKEALLWGAGLPPVRQFVGQHQVMQGFVQRYVAGETLADGLQVVRTLNEQGLGASLDRLGENVGNPAEAEAAADAYVQVLEAIHASGLDAYASLKLTQMGLDLSPELCLRNLRRILDRARQLNLFVRIDMESSAYTQRTLEMHERLWVAEGYRDVGIVLQAYLRRTAADVDGAIRLGVPVRLCKGAYLEPATIAFPRKADVDHNYVQLAERLLTDGNHPAIATHDGRIIRYLLDFCRARAIGPERFVFQMLYGVRRDLQRWLVAEGYRVRVYVPYGAEWYPYLTRRLAERPANTLFFVRALAREAMLGRN